MNLSGPINKSYIAAAHKDGACSEAIAWLTAQPRTYEELREQSTEWFGWGIARIAPAEVLTTLSKDAAAAVRWSVAQNPNYKETK